MKTQERFSIVLACMGWLSLTITHAEELGDRVQALEADVAELKQASLRTALDDAQVHGYGELHYNNLSGRGGASDKDSMDFHRFVLFFGYDFTDRTRFNSELELEHSLSGDEKPGEMEIEQAFIDFDLNEGHTARAGLFLVPVGLLNPTHEPPRFYGVERNSVEKHILPTTWWEAGAGLHGQLGAGWSYEAYLHSGLKTSTNGAYAVRSGRQKVAEADASDMAATIAAKWSAPGLTVGGAAQYQSDITQGADPDAGAAWLGEVHAEIRQGPLGLRALYAEWTLDGSGPESMGADSQYGWYVEPSYRVVDTVGVFARYSEWDNQAGDSDSSGRKSQWEAGVNWWPHEQVVLKADYQKQDNEDDKDQDGVNLGVGYEF